MHWTKNRTIHQLTCSCETQSSLSSLAPCQTLPRYYFCAHPFVFLKKKKGGWPLYQIYALIMWYMANALSGTSQIFSENFVSKTISMHFGIFSTEGILCDLSEEFFLHVNIWWDFGGKWKRTNETEHSWLAIHRRARWDFSQDTEVQNRELWHRSSH